MNDAIVKMFEKYNCQIQGEATHAFREILQEIALLGLWRSKFFEHSAFYGGTALRILYGLDRFSEDLDFSLLVPDDHFDLAYYMRALEKELAGFGFKVNGQIQNKSKQTAIKSAFLKTNTLQVLLEYEVKQSILAGINPDQLIKIKLEVDTDPPSGFNVDSKYLLQPIPFAVRTYTLPDLFAGKIHALLCRKWKNRVKGRDWYDFIWYCANHPKINIYHLEERLRQSGHWSKSKPLTLEEVKSLLISTIKNLNVSQAKKDVKSFIRTQQSLEVWSTDFFLSLIDRLDQTNARGIY